MMTARQYFIRQFQLSIFMTLVSFTELDTHLYQAVLVLYQAAISLQ